MAIRAYSEPCAARRPQASYGLSEPRRRGRACAGLRQSFLRVPRENAGPRAWHGARSCRVAPGAFPTARGVPMKRRMTGAVAALCGVAWAVGCGGSESSLQGGSSSTLATSSTTSSGAVSSTSAGSSVGTSSSLFSHDQSSSAVTTDYTTSSSLLTSSSFKSSTSSTSSSSSTSSKQCGTIRASDYDQTCAQDDDCVGVASGTFCSGGCSCTNAAIHKTAQAAYDAAFPNVGQLACPCAAPMVYCGGGQCRYGEKAIDAGGE